MVALREPATVGLATRIVAIPLKRTDTKVRDYVTRDEMDAVLGSLDRTHWCGRRYALLLTMYNSGARVSEIASLRRPHVTFGTTSYVQLHGKGRKERSIPLRANSVLTNAAQSLKRRSLHVITPFGKRDVKNRWTTSR